MRIQGDDGTMDGGRIRHYGIIHPVRLADYAPPRKRRLVLAVLLLAAHLASTHPASAQPAAETGGTWIGDCGAEAHAACTLRYREHLFSKAGVTADLEIRSAGAARVPVIVLRGLPQDPVLATAVSSQVDATLQLDQGAAAHLSCGSAGDAYVCQPDSGSRAALDRALPQAQGVTLSLAATLPGHDALSLGSRRFPLSGTQQALGRTPTLTGVPAGGAEPAIPPGWAGLVERALRAMGFQNGSTSLGAMLSRLFRH